MGLENLNCFLNMSAPQDFFTCLTTSTGQPVWSIFFTAILIIAVMGWGLRRPINEGMMVGGFLASLAGLGLVAFDLIPVGIWMVALLVTVAGIIITAIKKNNYD